MRSASGPCRVNRYNVLVSSGTGSRVFGKSGAGDGGAQSAPSLLPARTMSVLACLLAAITVAGAAPATYDQRQDGEFNVRADVQNVVFLVAIPQKMHFLDGLFKSAKNRDSEVRERADTVMEAFVEPNTPYHVEIGSERSADGDGRAVEVVIAGRRRLGGDLQAEPDDEIRLLGATENCGPDRERDPVSLTCRLRAQPDPSLTLPDSPQPQPDNEIKELAAQPAPEVVPAAS